jgi:hypothetical protein
VIIIKRSTRSYEGVVYDRKELKLAKFSSYFNKPTGPPRLGVYWPGLKLLISTPDI